MADERVSSVMSGVAVRAMGVVLMLLFAVAVVGTTSDRMSATKPLWEQVVPRPFADNAWRTRALLAVRRGDGPAALGAARFAMRSGPIEPGSSDLLGSALLLVGQADEADQAFRVAGQMGWRRPATQVYWMQQALVEGDYAVAVTRLDALLRQSPKLAGDPALMQQFESSPRGAPILLARLADRPPWTPDYLVQVEGLSLSELDDRARVLNNLAARIGPLGCAATGAVVDRLMSAGLADRADSVWRANCPSQSAGLVGDGDFVHTDLSRRDSLFSWWSPPDSDLSTSTDETQPPSEPRLIVASTSPFPRMVAVRRVRLQPGRYRLSWRSLGRDGRGSDRIAATIDCQWEVDRGAPATMDTRTGIAVAVVDVGTQCPAPWLSFRVQPGNDELRFGNVRMEPAP